MFFTFVLVYVFPFVGFVCAQMCAVVCDLWYLNVCVRGLQVMRAHSFPNFIFLVIKEKDELHILSLESVTSIKKSINLLKVIYHPSSCLSHYYIHFQRIAVKVTISFSS